MLVCMIECMIAVIEIIETYHSVNISAKHLEIGEKEAAPQQAILLQDPKYMMTRPHGLERHWPRIPVQAEKELLVLKSRD